MVSVVLVAIKFYAYRLTRSQAVLTDALESIINVFTSGFALYSLYLAEPAQGRKPPLRPRQSREPVAGLRGRH